jgi:DNA modification methylase
MKKEQPSQGATIDQTELPSSSGVESTPPASKKSKENGRRRGRKASKGSVQGLTPPSGSKDATPRRSPTPTVRVTCSATDLIDPETLTPFQGELKWLEEKQYEKLKASLLRHGFSFPVFAWKKGKASYVIDAHQRLLALSKMRAEGVGLEGGKVPVVWVEAEDERHAKELVLAAMSQYGRYDEDSIYKFISEAGLDWPDVKAFSDFTPVNMGKLEVGWFADKLNPDECDDLSPDIPIRAVVKTGEEWSLGDHTLICIDARQCELAPESTDFIFTSPPYNVGVNYESYVDSVPWSDYEQLIRSVLAQAIKSLKRGRAVGWNTGVSPKTQMFRQAVMIESLGLTFFRQLIWRKTGVPLPSFHITRTDSRIRTFSPNCVHEMVLLFTNGNLEKGPPAKFDRTLECDVFDIQQTLATRDVPSGHSQSGVEKTFTDNRRSRKAHPAVFPAALVRAFTRHFLARGEVLLDPFAGSGTCFIAAERESHRAIGIEIEPKYCDVIIERWQNFTGKKAKRLRR